MTLAKRNGNDFTARAQGRSGAAGARHGWTRAGWRVRRELHARKGVEARGSTRAQSKAGDFQALQNAPRDGRSDQLIYFVFDCLFKQKGGKRVRAWACEGKWDGALVSSTFELEWLLRSGNKGAFLEVDRAAFFTIDEARTKLTRRRRRCSLACSRP